MIAAAGVVLVGIYVLYRKYCKPNNSVDEVVANPNVNQETIQTHELQHAEISDDKS